MPCLDRSTLANYGSVPNSYLNFVTCHGFPVEPTSNTLSFYTVYMCHYINPRSINAYLSGISQHLEAEFPDVKNACNSHLVRRTLQGCMRLKGQPTVRKRALTLDDLHVITNHYINSTQHGDLLFVSMIMTGFFGLLQLGEMTFPIEKSLQDWKKATWRSTVHLHDSMYEFLLPRHKADCFFKGNKILISVPILAIIPCNISPSTSLLETVFIPLHSPCDSLLKVKSHKIIFPLSPPPLFQCGSSWPIHESQRSN